MPNEKKHFFAVAGSGLVFTGGLLYAALFLKAPIFGQNNAAQPLRFAAASVLDFNAPTSPAAPTPAPSVFTAAANNNNGNNNNNNNKPQQMPGVYSPLTLLAASENQKLEYNLAWAFGGKAQRGWFLYVPLIAQTIGAKENSSAPDFANLVGDWQQRAGIVPTTGKIDDETLYKFIEFWQSQRLNSSEYPTPDKLLTAPIADFYDPTRDIELTKVERQTYAAYKRMVAAAAKDKTLGLKSTPGGELAPEEKFLKIVSAFRSREYQNKLRQQSPNSGRAGLATNSPHFTGRALDLYVGGEPVTTKDFNRAAQVQTPVYKWLVKNAARFGFYPYYYEPWHWEYVGERTGNSNASVK